MVKTIIRRKVSQKHGVHQVSRSFGWDAHGYDAPSALRKAAELFEGPLSQAPLRFPLDFSLKHL